MLEEHCRCRAPLLSTQGVRSVHSEFLFGLKFLDCSDVLIAEGHSRCRAPLLSAQGEFSTSVLRVEAEHRPVFTIPFSGELKASVGLLTAG